MSFGIGMNFGASGQLAIVQGQSQTIHLELGQTGSVQIPAVDRNGDTLDFDEMMLKFVASDYRKAPVLIVIDGSIPRASGSFTVPLNLDSTAKKRTLRWRLLDVTEGGEVELMEGLFPVY